MPMFDSYLMVDWSAAAKPAKWPPGKDSIWWAAVQNGHETVVTHERTRAEAVDHLSLFLQREVVSGRRVLVGFDFALGYPAGLAEKVTGSGRARDLWKWLADEITDSQHKTKKEREADEFVRFDVAAKINAMYSEAGPFWSRPKRAGTRVPKAEPVSRTCIRHPLVDRAEKPCLCSDRPWPPRHPPYHRLTECFAFSGGGRPRPVWQLFFPPGAVGSQVLMGMPRLWSLIHAPRVKKQAVVWPFDGLTAPATRKGRACVVFVEIYPSILSNLVDAARHSGEITDRAQVRLCAWAFAQLDRCGDMRPLFSLRDLLPAADDRRQMVEDEEGWILGVGYEEKLRRALEESLRHAKC